MYKTILSVIALSLLSYCSESALESRRPNILWIFLEDTAPLLGSYGETLIKTPNIDNLAKQGELYTNVYMPAPVCSASRSSIITGLMATTIGAHNHHSSRTKESEITLPKGFQTIPEIFKNSGYFTFNNGKDDYNFIYDRLKLYSQDYKVHPLYGKSGIHIELSKLKDKQPFFGQIQLSGGKEIFSSTFKESVNTPVNRSKINLPPYLPDHPVLTKEYANHLDAIQITDEKVGKIVEELKKNNVLENTIIFFFSDHGMRITRNKQFLYDGGLHVPLIITDFTKSFKALSKGKKNTKLISGLDLGTSSLAIAGIKIPQYMEGENIFSDDNREYVISTRDRCDFTIDRIRSVRSKKFKYIKNFMTDRPYSQTTYMDVDGVEFVKTMHQLKKKDKLNPNQDRFMSDFRPSEELYDLINDPFELNNLALDLNYTSVLEEYSSVLKNWIIKTNDKGQYPEDFENLKYMYEIWGDYLVNPEYEKLRKEHPDLAGKKYYLRSNPFKIIKNAVAE